MSGGAQPAGEPTVVVRFRVPGQMAQLRCGDLALARNDVVIVETERGPAPATVLLPPAPAGTARPLQRVLRRADTDDQRVIERNRTREKEAFRFARERIRALGQPMKLVAVEIALSGNRALFYFSSAERIDFRALVKDLARRFHTRIEMRQIGVRDAARYTGGIGICGKVLCCSRWLPAFRPVSIRMAKDQNLALNSEKLSGVCGRLRCCLLYEQQSYAAARKGMPRLGKRVVTAAGEGRVKDLNVLARRVGVQLARGGYAEFDADSVARPPSTEQRRAPPRDSARAAGTGAAARASSTAAASRRPGRSGARGAPRLPESPAADRPASTGTVADTQRRASDAQPPRKRRRRRRRRPRKPKGQ